MLSSRGGLPRGLFRSLQLLVREPTFLGGQHRVGARFLLYVAPFVLRYGCLHDGEG
ncbi:hypothetical protein EMIT051CA3_70157 [Pseudomonas chlororaphis]